MSFQNCTFKGIYIGDHADVTIGYEANVSTQPIPRAQGVILREMGGGLQRLRVSAYVIKPTRADLELYMKNLAPQLGTSPGDLVVSGNTYTNCFLISLSFEENTNKFVKFSLEFLRSAY